MALKAMAKTVADREAVHRARPDGGGHHTGTAPALIKCLNCGTPLIGDHCHNCGQAAHVHRSLGAFWHDLLHGVLHLDGKIWRTLPLLAWRPGELTRRYIDGERAQFVSPMALFLFSVFAMFAVFSAVGGPVESGINEDTFRNTRAEMTIALEREQRNLGELQRRRAAAVKKGDRREVERSDENIAESREAVAALQRFTSKVGSERYQVIGGETGWKKLDEGIAKLNANPSLAVYKVQNNAYKFSWLLIPLSVPFLWLLFPFRRGIHLYDHTVFVTYSLAANTLLMVALSLARAAGVGSDWIGSAFAFLPPIHMYLQLRGAYRLRRRSALLRTLALLMFTGVALTLFLGALILLGALG